MTKGDRGEKGERICLNCSSYMPASVEEPTEFGFCLDDPEFEPFLDDILEHLDYDSCRELIARKRFLGEREACEDFEEAESIEVDDDSPLGKELRRLAEEGELDWEALLRVIMEQRFEQMDLKSLPVDEQVEKLGSSTDPEELRRAVESLGALVSIGHKRAYEALLKFFLGLPPVETLDDVRWKRRILWHLGRWEDRSSLVPHLVEELQRTRSNNTTRQWIFEVLRFLERCPWDVIREPLERLISSTTLSRKWRQRIRETLHRAYIKSHEQ